MQLLEIPLVKGLLYWENMEPFLSDEFTVVEMPIMLGDGMGGWASVLMPGDGMCSMSCN